MNLIDITNNAHKCVSRRYSGIYDPNISQNDEYRRITMDILTYKHVYEFEKQRWDKMMEIDNFVNNKDINRTNKKELENYKKSISNEFKEIYNHFQTCYKILDKSGLANDRLNEMRDTLRSYHAYIDSIQPIKVQQNESDRGRGGGRCYDKKVKVNSRRLASVSNQTVNENTQIEQARRDTADPLYVSDGNWQGNNIGRNYGRNNNSRYKSRNNSKNK